MTIDKKLEILLPKNQNKLFGYQSYFNFFISLYQKSLLPNTILLSGLRGSGKATFAYHFINYLLSENDESKYSLRDFSINPENKSYINLCNETHTNFSVLDKMNDDEEIKIDKVRNLLSFLNKSTFSSDIKIVLIDNIDCLNVHSANALLKVLEEANNKTFFFLINNNSYKILNTIKSRSIEFKISFSISEKKKILESLIKQYLDDFNVSSIDPIFYFDSPGNILKYLLILNNNNFDLLKDKSSCILYLIDKLKQKYDPGLLAFISFLIELFYNELSLNNYKNLNLYSVNKFKLLQIINNTKKFNLDRKNLFLSIKEIIENEAR